MSRIVECAYCGNPFEAKRCTTRWCSQACRFRVWRERNPKPAKPVREQRCDQCGEAFTAIGERKRRFCSPQCSISAQNGARPTTQDEWRTCAVCGAGFQPQQRRGVGKTYCSAACRQKVRYQRGKGARKFEVDYDALYKAQDGKCAICGQPPTLKDARNGRTTKKLAVDHCHETGAVRGLLCTGCNTGLGCFSDDIDRIRCAITYLERRGAELIDLAL